MANVFAHSGMPELQHTGLEYAYDKTAEVRKAYVDIYYVGQSDRATSYGVPILSLYRWRNSEVRELIRGTLSLQINFSTYDMANNALRFHTPPDPLLNLSETGFVRVGMLVSNISGLKMGEVDNISYQVLDETLDTAKHSVLNQYKHHMKKVFTVEVALDNQG